MERHRKDTLVASGVVQIQRLVIEREAPAFQIVSKQGTLLARLQLSFGPREKGYILPGAGHETMESSLPLLSLDRG